MKTEHKLIAAVAVVVILALGVWYARRTLRPILELMSSWGNRHRARHKGRWAAARH